jgi:hypothetical protein
MVHREFKKNDTFVNTVVATPQVHFQIQNGSIFYKNNFSNGTNTGHTALYDLNTAEIQPSAEDCPPNVRYKLDFQYVCNSYYIPTIT